MTELTPVIIPRSGGESAAFVARHFGVNELTAITLKKTNEKAIDERVVASSVSSINVVPHVRDFHLYAIKCVVPGHCPE